MPLVGLKCPPDVPTAGECHDFEFCIRQCPHPCQPIGVLGAIERDHKSNVHRGDMVSVTSLKGCPRSLILERTSDYYQEAHKLYYATRGGLYHGCLENERDGIITEKRLYKTITRGPMAPWTLSGQIDFYDVQKQSLEDYKTMSDKFLYIIFNHGAKPEHVDQVNIYRWLMWGGHLGAPDGPQVFWPVKEMKIHYLLMNRAISTGRVHAEVINDRKSPNYGKKYKLEIDHGHRDGNGQFIRQPIGQSRRGVPTWRMDIDIPPVPTLSSQEIEALIVDGGPTLVRAFRDSSFMPSGIMHDPDKNWACDFCPVKDKCDAIEQQLAMEAA